MCAERRFSCPSFFHPSTKRRMYKLLSNGLISPALANCALDGLEQLLKEDYPTGRCLKSLGGLRPAVNFIRYADDFVITSRSKDLLEGEVQPLVENFLQQRGLKLSPTKTVITTWRKALISSDKTCAVTLTGNCSSSLPRRMLKPSWMASEKRLKLGLACRLPI